MNKIGRSIVRMSAFLRKEVFEILRQPRLVFTLVLGPFLILLIFGIGYRNEPPALRTLFVVERGSELAAEIEAFATSLGPQLIYEGIVSDRQAALDALQNGNVDLVTIAPDDAYETIRNNEQAVFTLYHYEIDPFQVDYIRYFGQTYVDEVNRRVLRMITSEGQSEASTIQEDLSVARNSTSAMRSAIESDNEVAARQEQSRLNSSLANLSLALGASMGVLSGVEQTLGTGAETSAEQILGALSAVQTDADELNNSENDAAQLERLNRIEQNLTVLETNLAEFQSISPNVLVSPFRSEVQSISPIQPAAPDFYAPAVLALLLQHLAVTFAALSIVHERTGGTMELFRVSPLSAAETLFGKYLSYMLFGGIIAAVLSILLVFVLNVPMLGSWWKFSLVIFVLLFTSLSIGFIISILSQNDSQAVQLTMILLLASVFFSGFLMSLDTLWEPVRVVSWALPTTYGTILLRDISLRGLGIDWTLLGGLAAIGIGLGLIAWWLMRRLISRARA